MIEATVSPVSMIALFYFGIPALSRTFLLLFVLYSGVEFVARRCRKGDM